MRFRLRDERGITLPELLVGFVILVGVVGIGIALVSFTHRLALGTEAGTQTVTQLEDASTQLMRDVQDARRIVEATPTTLKLEVVRGGASDGSGSCVLTTWQVTGERTLDVTRITHTKAPGTPGDPACLDTGGERAHLTVVDRFEQDEPFAYFSRNNSTDPLPTPVVTDEVARVTWSLTSSPFYPEDAEARTVASGATLAQRTGTSGTGVVGDARSPLLSVTTRHEGVEAPALSWNDPTAELSATYTIFRIAYPEGAPAAGTWEALITLDPASARCEPGTGSRAGTAACTYTDTSLLPGHTGRYIVRANITDGRAGPTSNQVVTGLRPAVTTLTATGQETSIRLNWPAASGAVAYDLYRDGSLYQRSLTGTTWTDSTGYGHSHNYRIVPVNRWERCATRAATCSEANQTYQVPTGTAESASLPGGAITATRLLSSATAAAGAFTAPAAPTMSVTPNANWSNTLTWITNPTWTGTGPHVKDGVHRDRGWVARVAPGTGPAAGTFPDSPNVWGGAETPRGTNSRADAFTQAGVAGQYRHYQIRTCNASGCSPWTGTATALQRPPQPSCTATKTGITTRQASISISRPSIPSAYTSNRVNGWYEGGATSYVASTLTHSTTHTFGVHTRNDSPANGGWSDEAQCSMTTDPLRISIASTSRTTRNISATASATNGTSRNMTIEGVITQAGTGLNYNYLTHNTTYTVTARNTDGFNNVAAQTSVRTLQLTVATPAVPSCGATRDGQYAPTTVRFSSNASLNRTSVYASSAGYYSATATATNTNTDGWNTVSASRSASCGATVEERPWYQYGSRGGNSPQCSPYYGHGDVINSLDTGWRAFGAPAGTYTTWATNGTGRADGGTYIRGSFGSRDLACSMWRVHALNHSELGVQVGELVVSILWHSHGLDPF